MGRSKALLPYGASGHSFVSRIVTAMCDAGIDEILVVGRPADAALREAVSRLDPRARFVPNERHAAGQLTSIVAAVDAIDRSGVRGLLVMPVDMPLAEPETYAAILDAFRHEPRAIVRAVHRGRHGHPVIFDRGSFDALRHADPNVGAKAVLRARAARIVDADVPDAGAITDVDSVDDYVAVFGRPPAAERRD
jgi:CTP:molybdopterin cytidylyltransferase MocA